MHSTVLESLDRVLFVLSKGILVHLSITILEEPVDGNVRYSTIAIMLELVSK